VAQAGAPASRREEKKGGGGAVRQEQSCSDNSEVGASGVVLASSNVDKHHDPVAATCSTGCLS
jgi:hypothetical protein